MAPHDDGYGFHNADGSGARTSPDYTTPTPSQGYDELAVESPNYFGATSAQTTLGASSQGTGWDYSDILNSAIGGAIAFGGTAYSASQANEQGNKNRDFQKRMSETSYQRAMADMKLAGLNPMLAYTQGGASTPSGGIPSTPDMGAAIAGGASAASKTSEMGMKRQKLSGELALMDAGSRAASAQAHKAQTEARMVATGIPAAESRARWAATPEGQKFYRDAERNALGMTILTNEPGRYAGKMDDFLGLIEERLFGKDPKARGGPNQGVISKVLHGDGPPVGDPGYAKYQWEKRQRSKKK